MEEVWKTIEEYPDYEVSNLGRVRHGDKILKPSLDRYGYFLIRIGKDKKTFSIHRLVAITFLPNPDDLPVVNHKDCCKTTNFVWVNEDGSIDLEKSNLEWCSWSYNNSYNDKAKKIGFIKSKPIIQISTDDSFRLWPSAKECARETGLCYRNICNCLNGRRKSHNNFRFRFATYQDLCLSLWPTGETSGSVGQGNQLRFNWLGCKTEYGGSSPPGTSRKTPKSLTPK